VGGILKLVEDKRGKQKAFEYVSSTRVMLTYELPLNEIVLDFYDKLKTVSRGYASLDYHLAGAWESPMVKLDIWFRAIRSMRCRSSCIKISRTIADARWCRRCGS
jgi:translation elongation factor EF-4